MVAVQASLQDPDPRVNGGGFRKLRDAGVRVELGLRAETAHGLMEGFFTRIALGRPLITISNLIADSRSCSVMLDGFNAAPMGSDARRGLQDHPTVKPVAMVNDAILDVTSRGDIVLDSFAGSSSTLIAAEQAGRRAHCVEIDPIYVDLIIRRFEVVTGKKPALLHPDPTDDFSMIDAEVDNDFL